MGRRGGARPGSKRRLKIYPWHVRLLKFVIRRAPVTTIEVANALYRDVGAHRMVVARHELIDLLRMGLLQRDQAGLRSNDPRERWHPELFASAAIDAASK